jgi:hypothetical protein
MDLFLPGDIVERSPDFWDRLKSIWAPVDLASGRVHDKIEAATFVYELRNALESLGIHNARSLVVDGVTVFHDARGVDGDLPDLVLALSDHVSVFGDRSQDLKLSVEHEEAGLRMILDATVTSEHGREAPSARIVVVGQLAELDPRPGESAEAYRERLAPYVADATLAKTLRLQFGAFCARVQEALVRTFAETRVQASSEVLDVESMPREEAAQPIEAPPASDDTPSRDDEPPAPRGPRPRAVDTAAPARNFSMSAESRINALISGPPPFAVRLRRIEDLERDVIAALCECERTGSSSIPIAVARRIDEANALIRAHNRYYPVERNLPIDAATGGLLEMGEPWKPMQALTIDALRARARENGVPR